MKKIIGIIIITLVFNSNLNSQTGPGGIGNATGSNGHPLNLFWLDAGDLALTNGGPVTTWADKTSNNNDFGPSGNDPVNPTYNDIAYSFPIVRFSSATGTGSKLIRGSFAGFPDDNVSVIIVYTTSDSNDGLVSYAVSAGNSNAYLIFDNAGIQFHLNGSVASSGQAFNGGNFQIVTHKWRSNDGAFRMFQDGTQVYSTIHALGSTITNGGTLAIGGEQDDVDNGYETIQAFDGDIAEIIMFDAYINDAERTIIENYLNVKYGITISNDVFALGDASYTYDLTGVGQDGVGQDAGSHTTATSGSTGFYVESTGSLDNGDYIMFAHNNSANSVSTNDITGSVEERWAKDWYIEQTNSQNSTITFDLPEGISGDYPQNITNYVLLRRDNTTGDYEIATTSSVGYGDADQVAFDILGVNLTNGYYTLGTTDQTNSPVIGAPGTTWYTLVSGNWSNPDIWTLDPSGALPNNPTSSYPQNATDKVVIKTGKTVTMDLSGSTYTFASVTIDGRLDLQSKDHLYFDEIKGTGRILMSEDVFPKYTNADDFIKAGQGEGTVVFYGNSFTLDTIQEFYNLEIEMTVGQTITLTKDLDLNGYFRVETGTFQINDNSSTTGLNIMVSGDVEVVSGAFFHTGTGNARHQFNFYGDLTNNGELLFTNRVAADYNNEATNGIVDANFLNSSANQNILCSGITNFYRIKIDKGTDKTYILFIEASATANFNLFGYANEGHAGIAQLVSNSNALALLKGTVKIGNNVSIPVLNNAGNYNISVAAQLWVAGGTVTKLAGTAIVIYGTANVSAGTFEALVSDGFTIRGNGLIKVEGGTLNANQVQTSGAGNAGGYIQSGGTANVITPGTTNTDYYHFCLTFTDNVFNMSGGTLRIYDANGNTSTSGGIFINSDAENVNVTGGTVIAVIASSTNPYKITSRAPFYNLIVRNTLDNTTEHILDAGANVGSTDENLLAQPLVVYNDLTIENNVDLNANGSDLIIGGDLDYADGATYTHGGNTTWFAENSNSIIYIRNTTNPGELVFNDIGINKDQYSNPSLYYTVEVEGGARTANNHPIEIEGNLIIQRGEFDVNRWEVDVLGDISITDGQITATDAIPGQIVLNGAAQQTLTGSAVFSPNFGRIELDNANDATITTGIDLDYFILSNGVMDINEFKLSIDTNLIEDNTTGGFDVDNMLMTNGLAGDRGLEFNFDLSAATATGTIATFPLGVPGKYTPCEVVLNSTLGASYSGTMRVIPVDSYHPAIIDAFDFFANPYYWKTDVSSGLASVPTADISLFFYDPYSNYMVGENEYYLLGNVWTRETINASSPLSYDVGFITSDFTVSDDINFSISYVLYSRQSGDWNDPDTWSRDGHDGAPSGDTPLWIDVIYIGGTATANHTVTISANDSDCANLTIHSGDPALAGEPTLDVGTTTGHDFAEVHGGGRFKISYTTEIPNGDWNAYLYNDTSIFEYYGGTYNIPADISVYPNLYITGVGATTKTLPAQDILVRKNLYIDDETLAINSGNDLYILDSLIIDNAGLLQYPNTTSGISTVTVNKSIDLSGSTAANTLQIVTGGTNTSNHSLYIWEDIILNTNSVIDFYDAADNSVDLYFIGDGNSVVNNAGSTIDLNRLIINKSVSTVDVDMLEAFTLNGPTNGLSTEKALYLLSGELEINNAATNINLTTGGGDFSIPSSSSLELTLGQAYASGGSGINLNGKLLVSGGTVDMTGGDNYIEYSASGTATIEITSGTLSVGSQVRRGAGSDQGILIFNQSGGTVNIGTDAAGEATRGIFEILNTGSSFTHSAGDFYLVNDYRAGASTQSFYFDPGTVNLISGTAITFGNASTVAAEKDFTIYAGKDLMNLVIDNTSANNPTLTLNVVPLTLEENLTIASGTTLDANALNFNISGNFTNSGTFTANGNTTLFVGTDDQVITGVTTFYNLTKNTVNDLSLAASSEITIDNTLSLEDGTFNDNDNNVNAKGDVYSVITTSSAGTSDGIIMNGTAGQEITGAGTYAKLTINNPNGILVPTGYDITITENLKMQDGVFDIGQNLLVINANAAIEEASPFSESNMIQTNISLTDAGVRKFFPAIASATQFIYPMGSVEKYTPVQLDITACDAGGSIRIRAANERHISVIEDVDDPEIVDIDNVLQYHWTLDATDIDGFSATATMESYPGDVMVTPPYTVADYITAMLLDGGGGSWTKFDVADFNEATNELYFYFANTDDLGIDGDYTAGVDDAFPDQVPSYISVTDGPWNQAATWDTYPTAGGSVPAGGPRGAIMYVEHNVSMPANFMAAYITNIRSAGTVNVGTTFGHRLGIVNGTGELYLQRGDMPAGVYDGFFAPDSGTIVFNGTTDYDILSEVTYVNNITLSGSGERRFPNLDLIIYGDWVIGNGVDNPEVINEHHQIISIHEDIHFNSGSFDAGFGDNAIVRMAGNNHQLIYGDFTGSNAFYHFQMNNPAGTSLAGDIEINEKLILSLGVLFSTSANTVTLRSTATDIVTGGSNSSHVSGPLFKNITNGSSFYFPVGNGGRYGRCYLESDISNSTGDWQAQYYNQNPANTGMDPTSLQNPLTIASNNEYWRIQGPTGSDLGMVGLRWDSQSGMPTDASNISVMRIAEWQDLNPDLWVQVDASNSISSPGSTGTISSTVNSGFDEFVAVGNFFTLSAQYTIQNPVWDGSESTAWNVPNNWTPAEVPTSIDAVSIPNTGVTNEPAISSNAVCGSMNLESNRTLTINSGASLSLSGNLTMDGDITILSDATGTGSLIDNGTIGGGGTATVERYISGNFNYHYISSPLSALPHTTYSIAPWGDANPNFYIYNESINNTDWAYGWESGTSINPNMQVGRGYAFAFSYDYTFSMTGGNFNTGDQSIGVTNSGHTISSDGWNLIGNPYPSAISADELIFANTGTLDGTLYFWDDDGTQGDDYDSNDYATWNLAGAIGTGNGASSSSGSKVPDGFISNGQAFFVHAHTSGNVNFTNSMRSIGNGQFFKNAATDDVMRLRLSVSNDVERLYNEALLVFIQGATDGFDNFYDGKKLKGNSKIAFYSLLNEDVYAIQSFKPLNLKDNPVKAIPMGYKVTIAGSYSFNLMDMENMGVDVDVYLEDTETGIYTNLKETQNYSFTTIVGTFNGRFVIHFNHKGEYSNTAPLLRNKLGNVSILEDVGFEHVFDENSFGDVDNDVLTYTAKLANGNDLPAWLSFNSNSRTFTGVPENSDVAILDVQVTATDVHGATATDVFVLEVLNVNDAPQLSSAITDLQATEDLSFEFIFDESTFTDVDAGDVLTYSAKLANGNDLPVWLSFNANSRTFTGFPENSDVAILEIQLTATDLAGAAVSDDFILEVVNVNDAPELGSEIPDQEVDEGFDYSYTIPENTFTDIDFGDELILSAKQADGNGLPSWLIFDYQNGILYGTAENPGDLNIVITATDGEGVAVAEEFVLTVKSTTGINSLSSSEVTMYPNPTQGLFFVKTDYYSDDLMIIVRDFGGRVMKRVKPEGKETEIDIAEFSSGMYFIELNNKVESRVFKINLNK